MIQLSDKMKQDLAGALMGGHPVIVVGVTEAGEPTVSFRGTAQALGDDSLAFWSRNPAESTLVQSLATHDTLVLVYSNMADRSFYQFTGKARLNDDPKIDRIVWDNSPEGEQQRDPERLGSAVVVKLTSVRGRGPDGPVMMEA